MLAAAALSQTFYGSPDIQVFRDGRDKEFRNRAESPLSDEDFKTFGGLNYFADDASFSVKAELVRAPSEKAYWLPTSNGGTKKFVKYGVLKFRLGGKARSLTVYDMDQAAKDKYPEYADLLFIPFKDATNKAETYGGGRYIDIIRPDGKKVILNFNLAYNPNCAYGGDKWSCPIPPKENFLKVAVQAGEKRFAYTASKKLEGAEKK